MDYYILYTYENLRELREIQSTHEVFSFEFVETMEQLQDDPSIIVDITSLIYYLRSNKNDILPALRNLREITKDTKIIVTTELSESTLTMFPHLFSCSEPFFEPETAEEGTLEISRKIISRSPIYTYNNTNDLDVLLSYADANNIPFTTFSYASGNLKSELESFNAESKLAIVDMTSVSQSIEDNRNLVYHVETFLNRFPNIKLTAHVSQIDEIIKYFPLYVEGQKPISTILPEIKSSISVDNDILPSSVKRVVDLSRLEFNTFIDGLNYNLIGHERFKQELKHTLSNFVALNRAGEQNIFSIFLFGPSGIGKTEFARIIADGLKQDGSFTKINFQNYNRQDAINSLIGSPTGYIGCQHGELSDKVGKNKIGIILCDEFDKASRPVHLFFLELLEEGIFTDSMAREYDLDGYIIIFTSNISNKADYENTIPPELQTRFDLVCEFEIPTIVEKIKFVDLLIERAEKKFAEQFSQIQMTEHDRRSLHNFGYLNVDALRDIRRMFKNHLMDFFELKNVK